MIRYLTLYIFLQIAVINVFCQQNLNIQIAGKSGGDITINELKEAKKISAINDSIKITSFTVSFLLNGFFKEIKLNSDSFSEKCYTIFPEIIGKKLYIENVQGLLINGKNVSLGSFVYHITP